MKYSLFLGLSFVFFSCQDELNNFSLDETNTASIKMSAPNFISADSVSTRTILTPTDNGTAFSWKVGDVVAVYSSSKGMTNFYIDNESISEDGISADFNGSGFKLLENSTYYAFYPYSSSIQSLDKTAIPVSYLGQNMKSNGDFSSLGDFDYMYAKGITNNNGTVALSFQHLGCVVEYKLKVPKSSQYTQVRFELKSNAEKMLLHDGVVNITDETPYISLVNETVSDSIMTVKLNEYGNGIKVEKDSLLTVYMMMPPQDLSEDEINIRLVDSDENWYTAAVKGKNMRAGYTYHYDVNDETGGFTGSGTGLPDDELTAKLISTYTESSSMSYEGMILDGTILYTSGNFGVRAIDYSNENAPTLIKGQSLQKLTNNRTDMYARSIAIKDDYLYVPLRQSSGGSTENEMPETRMFFESYQGSYNDWAGANGISSNDYVNAFFKSLHISSINLNQNIKQAYVYKAVYQNGYYINTINKKAADGSSTVLFRETFATEEEALTALKSEYRNNYGDYCKVDWSALPKNGNIFRNFVFYTLAEFDSYQHSGYAEISSAEVPCPNRGNYSLRMETNGNSSTNAARLTHNIPSVTDEGYLSFWSRLDHASSDVEIPLISLSGDTKLSLVFSSASNSEYNIALKTANNIATGKSGFKLAEWYNFKIQISEGNVRLWYREKEASNWFSEVVLTNSGTITFNELQTGIVTSGSNAIIYFDDYYYDKSNIDDVAYVNGKLAILNKNTLEVSKIYNLDLKAIDAKIYENRLVLTCFYGFNVYDISDPESPKLTYTYRTDSYKESQDCEFFTRNGRVYVLICNYMLGYTIADVTDVNNVEIMYVNDFSNLICNGVDVSGKAYSFDVSIDYPYAYLTISTNRNYINTESDIRGIVTIDLSDFNNPSPHFSLVPSDDVTTVTGGDPRPTHIAKSNDYLIINNADKGLLVFLIGNNGWPVYTGAVTVSGKPCINNIYVPYDGIMFVNDNNHGGSARNIYLFKGF